MDSMINPYESPTSNTMGGWVTDKISRDSLNTLIRSFLAEDITAFEFDEGLDEFWHSEDPIIRHVLGAVWPYYDDCDDHLACLSKPQWDYFQRLLLVLESDCRIETSSQRHWSFKQVFAGATLLAYAYVAIPFGWGSQLFVMSIPFGIISILLSFWHVGDNNSEPDPYVAAIWPFASFSDLETAYRSSKFRKTRYPKQIAHRKIRSPAMETFWQLHTYVMWAIFSPIPLLVQTLPTTQTETRVIAS